MSDWKDQIDSGALSSRQVAVGFAASAEFHLAYGSQSNRDFVESLYRNAFDRGDEWAGINA